MNSLLGLVNVNISFLALLIGGTPSAGRTRSYLYLGTSKSTVIVCFPIGEVT